jgi:hypothetical protein
MEERLNIYVGCTLFTINKSTVQRYPETLLGSMSKSLEYYNKDHDCFYFDRNPELFNTILDFYRNCNINALCLALKIAKDKKICFPYFGM